MYGCKKLTMMALHPSLSILIHTRYTVNVIKHVEYHLSLQIAIPYHGFSFSRLHGFSIYYDIYIYIYIARERERDQTR